VTVGNWGGYDCDGLLGSIDNRGGPAPANPLTHHVSVHSLSPVAEGHFPVRQALTPPLPASRD